MVTPLVLLLGRRLFKNIIVWLTLILHMISLVFPGLQSLRLWQLLPFQQYSLFKKGKAVPSMLILIDGKEKTANVISIVILELDIDDQQVSL